MIRDLTGTNVTTQNDAVMLLQKELIEKPADLYYICSPLRGNTREETFQNMLTARKYMLQAWERTGHPAVAPHAYLPLILDDYDPEERTMAIEIGKMLMQRCTGLLVYGKKISEGMKGEILTAARKGMPIFTFSNEMCKLVEDLLSKTNIIYSICKDIDEVNIIYSFCTDADKQGNP